MREEGKRERMEKGKKRRKPVRGEGREGAKGRNERQMKVGGKNESQVIRV